MTAMLGIKGSGLVVLTYFINYEERGFVGGLRTIYTKESNCWRKGG